MEVGHPPLLPRVEQCKFGINHEKHTEPLPQGPRLPIKLAVELVLIHMVLVFVGRQYTRLTRSWKFIMRPQNATKVRQYIVGLYSLHGGPGVSGAGRAGGGGCESEAYIAIETPRYCSCLQHGIPPSRAQSLSELVPDRGHLC